MMLPNGDVVSADIKNCRCIVIGPPRIARCRSSARHGACLHDPPRRFGSPNGAFPMTNGHYLVTEINGDWVDEIEPDRARVSWSTHPPGVIVPLRHQRGLPWPVPDGRLLRPGQVVGVQRPPACCCGASAD